jgi:hypothetical protein
LVISINDDDYVFLSYEWRFWYNIWNRK